MADVNLTISSGVTVSIGVGSVASYRSQYFIFTDGTNTVRRGVRDGHDVYDVALTATGFDGIEDTDWKNKEKDPIQ